MERASGDDHLARWHVQDEAFLVAESAFDLGDQRRVGPARVHIGARLEEPSAAREPSD
jgi:hypothetical protein